ncbi:MAG TPA: cytochrome c, partial [Ferruginibacter sp.]|nr:cytochrome c [Ferruginibacter sp.]
TILLTKSGCIINLPKGTLESEGNNVKLEIKEALSNTDIVMAGLTTMSGRQPLSSGGMIYINAAEGYEVEIKKQVEVLIPTKSYNPAMQVYKGEEKNNGGIDWVEPAALPEDETLIKINTGEGLFKANCASCHKIDRIFTGPSLAGITERRPKQWLYAFTRNPAKLIANGYYTEGPEQVTISDSSTGKIIPDFYSSCMAHKWRPATMTAFPMLTDADLEALYAYIKTESDRLPKPIASSGADCCDSCDTYGKALFVASKEFKDVRLKTDEFFNLDITVPIPVTNDTIEPQPIINTTVPEVPQDMPAVVTPGRAKATYYTINIKAFGWYNIDILIKNDPQCSPSELFVRIQGSYEVDLNVVLIIPSIKVFVEGGKLKDGRQYGFYETDGKIPLPQNAQCYVMAFGEYKDNIIFGKTSFTAKETQTVDIAMVVITKELMNVRIKELNLDGVDLEVKKVLPPTVKDEKFDKKMEEAMKLRPKNCACGFER